MSYQIQSRPWSAFFQYFFSPQAVKKNLEEQEFDEEENPYPTVTSYMVDQIAHEMLQDPSHPFHHASAPPLPRPSPSHSILHHDVTFTHTHAHPTENLPPQEQHLAHQFLQELNQRRPLTQHNLLCKQLDLFRRTHGTPDTVHIGPYVYGITYSQRPIEPQSHSKLRRAPKPVIMNLTPKSYLFA